MQEGTWYSRNREMALETSRCYYEKNKAVILAAMHMNLEKQRARKTAWNQNNRARINAAAKRYYANHPGAKRAQHIVERAVERGELVRPAKCNRCRTRAKVVGHHADYSKPLVVEWLCRSCHNFIKEAKHGLNHTVIDKSF